MPGNLIIVSAPSGTGKTTLVNSVIDRDDRVKPSISYTSRAVRPGEVNGAHYFFVSSEEFDGMIERGDFLEWARVHGNLYGTSRRQVADLLDKGMDVVLTIDVQGAEQARRLFPHSVGVFILPPSRQALIDRLDTRGVNSDSDINLRLKNAVEEIARFQSFDYLIVNDDLEKAINELAAIILAERCRSGRRAHTAREILGTF